MRPNVPLPKILFHRAKKLPDFGGKNFGVLAGNFEFG
jgi:hypothetical protein